MRDENTKYNKESSVPFANECGSEVTSEEFFDAWRIGSISEELDRLRSLAGDGQDEEAHDEGSVTRPTCDIEFGHDEILPIDSDSELRPEAE